ncbi:MAG TPA: DinB family protein [Bacteroidota bacterium]|jgi:hypothetical protein|nr:DinB family protein [Bacteroidota bacterium]
MKAAANNLRSIIEASRPRLLAITENEASAKPHGEKWSLKEILGHLVDSVSTNHQRIVRMQQVADLGKFGYDQEHWVNSQNYKNESWNDIVNIWYFYNKHLAHVMEHVDAKKLTNVCDMDYEQPKTLEFVITDYARHMQHHLDQIFSGADPRERSKWETT